jgi:hypothetical protein
MQSPGEKTSPTRRRLPWGSLTMAGLVLFGLWIWVSPPNSFHPTCTYSVNAVVSAEVEVSGEKLSSEVVHQNSGSRQWISIMNSAGCKQRYGNALVYRLANDSVLIVAARLCYAATKEIGRSGHADILSTCTGKQARQDRAYIVDSASRPETWRKAVNGVDFRILGMTATSTWRHPTDDIETIAPNLLKSYFNHDRNRGIKWGDTPETVLDYARRYDVKKNRPNKSFEFEVQYEMF